MVWVYMYVYVLSKHWETVDSMQVKTLGSLSKFSKVVMITFSPQYVLSTLLFGVLLAP